MSAPLAAAPEVNEADITSNITSRVTKGGRRLHYELKCLQQPERARACGSGQKSAADRRPVDPPPVVQLRVLEGPTISEAKDITLSYPANFFVFVDLQHARPIANGRVQTPAAVNNATPVLTGSPVSGMAYLDRPTEAGYFLFPDLSVRHEGRYVLGFSLYEELKEDQDQDADQLEADECNQNFFLRMQVHSAPFVVFSAKKFPGLTSSTSLSRTISEQGCRVRIRREVRMRRREPKPSANDHDKDEDASSYRRRAETPDVKKEQLRDRSISNSSEQRRPFMPERRPSEADGYAPPPPGPAPPSSHARYGSDVSSTGYNSQYIQPAPQAPPISPATAHYPPTQPSPYAAAPPPSSYGYQTRPAPQPYRAPTPVDNHFARPVTPAVDHYTGRPTSISRVPPSPSRSQSISMSKDDYRPEPDYRTEMDTRKDSYSLAPVTAPPSSTTAPLSIKLPSIKDGLAPLSHTPSYQPSPVSAPRYSQPTPQASPQYIEPAPPAGPPPPPETARAGSKRAYNETFADHTGSLYDRQRPQDPHHAVGPGRPSAMYYDREDPGQMWYSRADGSMTHKTCNTFTY